MFHLSADHGVLNSLYRHNHESTSEYSLSSRGASRPNYRLQIDCLQVLLQSRLIMASKCISQLARSQPPSASPTLLVHSLQVYLQTCSNTASNCISELTQFWPPSSHDLGFQVHLHTCRIRPLESISKFTGSQCGETMELDARQPIMNTLPHVAWHPKGIFEKELFWLEEHRNRVRHYERMPGHHEPHTLCGSKKALQECMRLRAGKDRVCISYNEMISIYPRVSQIYTSCR